MQDPIAILEGRELVTLRALLQVADAIPEVIDEVELQLRRAGIADPYGSIVRLQHLAAA
jgi:hypothetical protein